MPKVVKNIILGTGAVIAGLEGIGATTTELTDKVPFLNNHAYTIDYGLMQKAGYDALHPLDWIKNISTPEIIVSPTYDNKADKQGIQAGINAIPISEGDLPALLKNAIKPVDPTNIKNPPEVSFLMPIRLEKDEKIEISTTYRRVPGGLNTGIPDYYLPNGKKFLVSNTGTEIVVPMGGAEVFKFPYKEVDGKTYFDGAGIRFYGPDGTRFILIIKAQDDIRHLLPLDAIKDAPIASFTDFIDNKLNSKGLSLPAGTPFLKTNSNNTIIDMYLDYSGYAGSFSFFADTQTNKILFFPAASTN